MENVTLYFCPLTCSRVTMTALEETGLAFEADLVNLMAGAQKSAEYLAINPEGKVPALRIGETVLTENVAILLYLHARFPEAALLPAKTDLAEGARAWSDLAWCSTTLHPLARQLRAPGHYTDGNTADVVAKGQSVIAPALAALNLRFGEGPWWYGGTWSIIDTYLSWICATCGSTGYDMTPFPEIGGHIARTRERPAFRRMMARERAAMDAVGMTLPPGVEL